ncbi:hypothetical protein A2867_01265 [Candidatus Daviesbacteria bacterium RIFCSPHIGHO2_01_FULL_40_11]|uniref:Uncharacterized protein n=1 Tax=Candidatus Daviesbacteria bacterium RIFCSPHIGHO2_01_FULL_40_11 TaxID=1797762 RepID=A0A1F5JHQ5_9BACT|nr:MAG: hypothetical protein A2867_01265 [Candidatus Daviesbacteria bacterium RIFCSPHIGHO2_01_FULL_40_11]
MKTCEAAEGIVHEIVGHKLDWGPIKAFAILGPEVPVEEDGYKKQIVLEEDILYDCGVLAQMVCPEAVDLYGFHGVARSDQPLARLVGRQINKDPLTRNYLRWVKRKVLNSYTEAAQQPDSTL